MKHRDPASKFVTKIFIRFLRYIDKQNLKKPVLQCAEYLQITAVICLTIKVISMTLYLYSITTNKLPL
jgi:hypothetical protein